MTVSKGTNPWRNRDAIEAAVLSATHYAWSKQFEIDRSDESAQKLAELQNSRETHQKKTGWVAEHQGEGEWVFTYSDPTQVDPDTGYKTGQPIIITTVEETR